MKLYHLTAIAPTSKRVVVEGSFTAPRQQELITGTACTLELYRLQPKESKLIPLFRVNVFANIQTLATFRLPATKRDFLLMTSDAGTLTILAVDESTSTFEKIHCEALGKTGIRRIVPGHFLASDPRGRACMVAAFEKVKLCFVLNRDTEENLTVSSALEANKSNTVTIAIVGVDVGFENPVFAALERSYENDTGKQLVYYELDLGLNHVSRKAVSTVRESTLSMIPVPGHQDGPGGVLLISLEYITYCNLLSDGREAENLECRMPYRRGSALCKSMVASSTMYRDKKRKVFFFMICTENGDLIKADIQWSAAEGATQLRLAYFDSISSPATSMCIFRAGFLAVSMEGSDTALLRFGNVEVKEDDPAGGYSVSRCTKPTNGTTGISENSNKAPLSSMHGRRQQCGTEPLAPNCEFRPRSKLENLTKVEAHRTLASLLGLHATRDALGRPLLLTTSGRGECANFSALRRGTNLLDISNQVKLPFRVENVFTLTDSIESLYHSFVIVSSCKQTMVLKVQDGTIQESPDSGLEEAAATVFVGLMSNRSFVQVHSGGVRFLPNGRTKEATEWKPASGLSILAGCGNRTQLVVTLSSGALVYFEVDDESGLLTEADRLEGVLWRSETASDPVVAKMNAGRTASIAIQQTPPGRMKASFFAAADGVSAKIRLFRIKPAGSVEPLGLQIAPAPVFSLALVDFGVAIRSKLRNLSGADETTKEQTKQEQSHLRKGYDPMIYLILGTTNGVVTRVAVDANTGVMSSKRTMFVGFGPIRVAACRMGEVRVCLLLGSQSVLLHRQGGRVMTLPLLTNPIYHAAALSSPRFGNGMVAVAEASLRLLAFKSTEIFSSSMARLSSLPPVLLPTKINLDFSYHMDRDKVLGTPRRIIPVCLKHSATDPEHKVGRISDGRPVQLFVLLETDRIQTLPIPEQDDKLAASEKLSKAMTRRETGRVSLSPLWYSTIQIFRLNAGKDQATVSGSSRGMDFEGSALHLIDSKTLPKSERVLDGTSTVFRAEDSSSEGRTYVVVSIARPHVMSAWSAEQPGDAQMSGSLLTYAVDTSTFKLSLLHDTVLPEPAHAVTSFRDMIAVGSGRSLQLYSLGKKKLLKKAECMYAVPNKVVALSAEGSDRLFVGDIRESVTVYKYVCTSHTHSVLEEGVPQSHGGRFIVIGSDAIPRWISAMAPLDYNSVVCGDKFGNVFVLRLSKTDSTLSGDTLHGIEPQHENFQSVVYGEGDKLVTEAYIHVGSTVMGLTLGSFRMRPDVIEHSNKPNDDAIIYATIDGSIGLLTPLRRQSDISLTLSVESQMRKQHISLCGRDHMTFRSSFCPVKNVIDGDLCEMFDTIPWDRKSDCARQIGRSVTEIVNKLDELRSSVM